MKNYSMILRKQALGTLLCATILLYPHQSCSPGGQDNPIFADDNLVAWCIVPYDAKQRNPEERAKMLHDLGITKLAYDWRDQDIPTFDEEWKAMNKYGINMQAFWMIAEEDPENDHRVQVIFDFLKRNHVNTQIWLMMTNIPGLDEDALSQEEKIRKVAEPIRYLALRADSLGCQLALYNHGEWYGEPENQLAILNYLQLPNLGMVYNFHHGRQHMERFPEFFPKILPHLMGLNLAGLKKGDTEKFYRIGEGDAEQDMIAQVWKSGYKGPIGIIGHDETVDAEVALKKEMDGLKKVLQEIRESEAGK